MQEYIKNTYLESEVTALIISNKEMDDIIKIVKSFEESDLFIKSVNKTIENEAKEQKSGFLTLSYVSR